MRFRKLRVPYEACVALAECLQPHPLTTDWGTWPGGKLPLYKRPAGPPESAAPAASEVGSPWPPAVGATRAGGGMAVPPKPTTPPRPAVPPKPDADPPGTPPGTLPGTNQAGRPERPQTG
jgi:hypothetical protein